MLTVEILLLVTIIVAAACALVYTHLRLKRLHKEKYKFMRFEREMHDAVFAYSFVAGLVQVAVLLTMGTTAGSIFLACIPIAPLAWGNGIRAATSKET